MLELSSSESITLDIPNQSVPFRYYLEQPQRLVHALISPNQVVGLGDKQFRLYLRTIVFFMLRIQPIVDLKITASDDGQLSLKSVACKIQGNEFVDQNFDLSLKGHLNSIVQAQSTCLVGQAALKISVGIPPILQFVPLALLETTGNHILRSTLVTMKQRLTHKLSTDYRRWSDAQQGSSALK
ncbi:MAG: DUF1997 domain-containing protein [Cyanobacteria bacterium]|nr:DUF1997 domain-containing protein [Cyanobacteriota bacterium]